MKLAVLAFLAICFISLSAFATEHCGGPYYDAAGVEGQAGKLMAEGGQHYVTAYTEIENENPDMNVVCHALDGAAEKFEATIPLYTKCFKLYKRAEEVCEEQYRHLAVEGMNRCDKAGSESPQLVATMNQLFAQYCN